MIAQPTFSRLLAEIPLGMSADAASLTRRLEHARRSRAAPAEWERVAAAIARSVERRRARSARRPVIAYPEDLPVAARAAEIATAIREHQVIIVCGETGSGKTTQLDRKSTRLNSSH